MNASKTLENKKNEQQVISDQTLIKQQKVRNEELKKEIVNLQAQEEKCDVYVISLGDVGTYGARITQKLREAGFRAEMDYQNRSLKAQFKSCDRLGVKAIVIAGSDEVANNTVQLKDTVNKTQETIGFNQIVERVGNILK